MKHDYTQYVASQEHHADALPWSYTTIKESRHTLTTHEIVLYILLECLDLENERTQ